MVKHICLEYTFQAYSNITKSLPFISRQWSRRKAACNTAARELHCSI